MTVIVAARCRDGAIMASDSQATEMVAGVRWDVQKVFPLTARAVWGASGLSSVIDDVRREIESSSETLAKTSNLMNSFRGLIHPIMKRHYDYFLPPPGGGQSASPETDFV